MDRPKPGRVQGAVMENSGPVNPALVFSLRLRHRARCLRRFQLDWTEATAVTAAAPALDAMRSALAEIDIDAVVVIGEATKGEAPQPQRGERLGRPGLLLQGRHRPRSGRGHELSRARTDQRACRACRRSARRHDESGTRLLHGEVRGDPRRRAARSIRTGRRRRSSRPSPRRSARTSRISPCSCWRSRATAIS